MRHDKSLPNDDFSNPIKYWSATRKGLREKSNHNKLESQFCFFSAIMFSISAPLFIAFGTDLFFGKIVPAVLSALVAASTSWLQLRQPQRLWAIYRTAQRELEDEKVKFDNELAEYADTKAKAKLLAERTASIAMGVHRKWEGIVPDSSSLGAIPLNKGDN